MPSKQQVPEYDEPSIGRIRARNIAPPRTAGIIKRAILRAESIDPSRVSNLFLVASGSNDAVDDEIRLDVTDEKGQGPGSSPESPIGIVLGLGHENVAGITVSRTEPGLVATNVKPKGWRAGKTSGSSICEIKRLLYHVVAHVQYFSGRSCFSHQKRRRNSLDGWINPRGTARIRRCVKSHQHYRWGKSLCVYAIPHHITLLMVIQIPCTR